MPQIFAKAFIGSLVLFCLVSEPDYKLVAGVVYVVILDRQGIRKGGAELVFISLDLFANFDIFEL
jgi:hypothetical protein